MGSKNKFENSHFNPQQIQAITSWGNNILVSASAGSGKTSVLIERILYHIQERQINIDELLVVTFTEAAAREMKERLDKGLKEAVNQTLDSQMKQNYMNQINKVPLAHIRTLHSFCLQVVQNFFYLIDFNPNFSLMTDETQLHLIYEKIWAQLIESIYQGQEDLIDRDQYFELLQIFSKPREDTRLFELILDLINFSASHTQPLGWLSQIAEYQMDFQAYLKSKIFQENILMDVAFQIDTALKSIDMAETIVKTFEAKEIDKYYPIIEHDRQIFQNLKELFYQGDLEVFIRKLMASKEMAWERNSKNKMDYEAIIQAKNYRDLWKKTLTNLQKIFPYSYETYKKIEEANVNTIQNLGQLALAYYHKLNKYKLNQNILTYNDLEHLTLDILAPLDLKTGQRQPSLAALYYQNKFKEVMVDEYQDINDIQAEILSYLSHENIADQPGNLFMVGDVKQSIYGFRMAEPSLFLKKYQAYQTGQDGILIILDKNYRSRHVVLQFTNFIFERIMDEDFGQMNYGINEALSTANDSFLAQAPSDKYNIQLLLYCSGQESDPSDEEGESDLDILNIDNSVEGQAHIMAQSIKAQVENQQLIFDKKLGKERPIQYSDIVILSSSKNPFNTIQEVFSSYQIPIFAQKVENFFQRQEIQIMVALLKILDNPIQDIPLVAILRSYFVGLSDEELAMIRIFDQTGSYYEALRGYAYSKDSNVNIHLQEKITYFLEKIEEWGNLAKKVSLVELIWTIYTDSQFLEYNAGLANANQRLANLHALYERAASFESQQFKGLANFVAYIEKVMSQDRDLAEPISLDEGDNFVRIMTVHASKGLEFPILYLMNTQKQFNLKDLNKVYIGHKDYGIATDYHHISDKLRFETLTRKTLKISQELKLKAEEMRKLYVAFTRCEQKLFIVASIESQEKWQSDLEAIRDLLDPNDTIIPQGERRRSKSWLDWIQQAMALPDMTQSVADFNIQQIESHFISRFDLQDVLQKQGTQQKTKNRSQWLAENFSTINQVPSWQYLNDLLAYEYPNQISSQTSSYQSVSELKRLNEEPLIEKSDYYTNHLQKTEFHRQSLLNTQQFPKPAFMEGQSHKVDYAKIGTLTHFIMQHLDYGQFSRLEITSYPRELAYQMDQLTQNHEDLYDYFKHIQTDNILVFLKSQLGQTMIKHYPLLKQELAFSILVDSQSILEQEINSDDQILIHGMIDAYIEFEREIILLDFKTDRYHTYGNQTKQEQILGIIQKYQFQLSLYKNALEKTLNKNVSHAYLALLDFQENIDLSTE